MPFHIQLPKFDHRVLRNGIPPIVDVPNNVPNITGYDAHTSTSANTTVLSSLAYKAAKAALIGKFRSNVECEATKHAIMRETSIKSASKQKKKILSQLIARRQECESFDANQNLGPTGHQTDRRNPRFAIEESDFSSMAGDPSQQKVDKVSWKKGLQPVYLINESSEDGTKDLKLDSAFSRPISAGCEDLSSSALFRKKYLRTSSRSDHLVQTVLLPHGMALSLRDVAPGNVPQPSTSVAKIPNAVENLRNGERSVKPVAPYAKRSDFGRVERFFSAIPSFSRQPHSYHRQGVKLVKSVERDTMSDFKKSFHGIEELDLNILKSTNETAADNVNSCNHNLGKMQTGLSYHCAEKSPTLSTCERDDGREVVDFFPNQQIAKMKVHAPENWGAEPLQISKPATIFSEKSMQKRKAKIVQHGTTSNSHHLSVGTKKHEDDNSSINIAHAATGASNTIDGMQELACGVPGVISVPAVWASPSDGREGISGTTDLRVIKGDAKNFLAFAVKETSETPASLESGGCGDHSVLSKEKVEPLNEIALARTKPVMSDEFHVFSGIQSDFGQNTLQKVSEDLVSRELGSFKKFNGEANMALTSTEKKMPPHYDDKDVNMVANAIFFKYVQELTYLYDRERKIRREQCEKELKMYKKQYMRSLRSYYQKIARQKKESLNRREQHRAVHVWRLLDTQKKIMETTEKMAARRGIYEQCYDLEEDIIHELSQFTAGEKEGAISIPTGGIEGLMPAEGSLGVGENAPKTGADHSRRRLWLKKQLGFMALSKSNRAIAHRHQRAHRVFMENLNHAVRANLDRAFTASKSSTADAMESESFQKIVNMIEVPQSYISNAPLVLEDEQDVVFTAFQNVSYRSEDTK